MTPYLWVLVLYEAGPNVPSLSFLLRNSKQRQKGLALGSARNWRARNLIPGRVRQTGKQWAGKHTNGIPKDQPSQGTQTKRIR